MPTPKNGYWLANGERVPGVTTILGRFKESGGLLQWAFQQGASGVSHLYEKSEEASDIGTFVHLRWENNLNGKEVVQYPKEFTPDMIKQADTSYSAAVRWQEDCGLKITPIEQPFVSESYKFGGTPDAVAMGKRGGALADWKTGAIYTDTWLQMAAYVHLIKECSPETDLSDGVHLVRFGKLGEFNHLHIPLEHPGLVLAWEQFTALIPCYQRDKILKKMT